MLTDSVSISSSSSQSNFRCCRSFHHCFDRIIQTVESKIFRIFRARIIKYNKMKSKSFLVIFYDSFISQFYFIKISADSNISQITSFSVYLMIRVATRSVYTEYVLSCVLSGLILLGRLKCSALSIFILFLSFFSKLLHFFI